MDDDVAAASEQVQKLWADATQAAQKQLQAIVACESTRDAAALPRMNALVQDRMATLRSLMLRLELIAQQYPTEEGSESCSRMLQEWKDQYQALRMSLRNANVQAKVNVEKAAKDEREQLLSGGEDATLRRRQLQTKAGITAAAESITDGLRRTRQMMVQEVERNTATLSMLDESNSTLRMTDKEYKGQRSILNTTRYMLTSLQRQDVIDRVIVVFFVILFLLVCGYIVQKRLPILRLGRKAPVLPSYKPPLKVPEPPLPVQSPQYSPPKLDSARSAPQFYEHQAAEPRLGSAQSAPEPLFYASDQVNEPLYHEEL
ncbi:unnamed protein product [Sphagnum balticum]